ncbi:PAAR domain-containing protein [Hydromonas duriensis]|uniref:Putative Zn-binding protein involved in type VI secretion n=1 Tax=Hydromonas duriensis TaxID=1527608 RepID=A0A4R6Y0S1_9BURK|nr:PAAR domain-containing protein [Hydromonas duriensis]TDR28942.1 putative Zn-binding protein involved in type VI secretion [Hydromonas duriensis]
MAYPVSKVGDTSDHGGAIVTGSSLFQVNGVPVARIGDILACPTHGNNPIESSLAAHAQDEGKQLAHIGSKTQCGATITTGDASFMVE